jgi:hypothetical protein
MLKFFKSFFADTGLTVKKANATLNEELDLSDLRDFPEDHEFGVSVDGIARIRQMKNGKFRLLVNQNEVVGTYARRRDAIRGADRKGLTVVEA